MKRFLWVLPFMVLISLIRSHAMDHVQGDESESTPTLNQDTQVYLTREQIIQELASIKHELDESLKELHSAETQLGVLASNSFS